MRVETLPLTPNGKIDRRALPAPGADRSGVARRFIAPRDDQETTLSQIWSKLLGRSPIGAGDNFFELGGHSLLATRLVSQIREVVRGGPADPCGVRCAHAGGTCSADSRGRGRATVPHPRSLASRRKDVYDGWGGYCWIF